SGGFRRQAEAEAGAAERGRMDRCFASESLGAGFDGDEAQALAVVFAAVEGMEDLVLEFRCHSGSVVMNFDVNPAGRKAHRYLDLAVFTGGVGGIDNEVVQCLQ